MALTTTTKLINRLCATIHAIRYSDQGVTTSLLLGACHTFLTQVPRIDASTANDMFMMLYTLIQHLPKITTNWVRVLTLIGIELTKYHSLSVQVVAAITSGTVVSWDHLSASIVHIHDSLSIVDMPSGTTVLTQLLTLCATNAVARARIYAHYTDSAYEGDRDNLDCAYIIAALVADRADDHAILATMTQTLFTGPRFSAKLNQLVADYGNARIWSTIYTIIKPCSA